MMMSNLTDNNRSWIWSVVLTAVLGVLAVYSFRKNWPPNTSNGWIIWLGIAAGGIGGLVHEFGQSGGKLLFFKRAEDVIYLGALAGMFMGMVVGAIAVQGLFTQQPAPANQSQASAAVGTPNAGQPTQPAPAPRQPLAVEAFYAAFLAGLSLKGFAEAVGGQPPVAGGTAPVVPGPIMTIDLPATPVPPTLH